MWRKRSAPEHDERKRRRALIDPHQRKLTKETKDWRKWGDKDRFTTACAELLNNDDKQRLAWLTELENQSDRVLKKRHDAAAATTSAHWFQRGAAGASGAVATLSGGTLIGDVHGAGATVIGIIAGVVGLSSAAIASAKPGASYTVDLTKKAQYEQLWWDMRSYGLTQLPHVEPQAHQTAMGDFAKREAGIMATAPASEGGQ